jgi:probable HAF family extracellular repeat protein
VALPLVGLNDASRITDSGIVLGSITVGGRAHAARLFTPGGFIQDMMSASTGTDYYGQDINNAGVIIGWYQSSSSSGGVFRVGPNPNQFTTIASPVGYNADNVEAINDRGVVVGSMIHETTFREHAFRNRNGITEDLGTLPGDSYSFAYDINNDGAIVGTSRHTSGTRRAVAWREDGTIIDLEAWLNENNPAAGAKWTLLDATSISSNGYVVGAGQYEGVYQHYLLDATGFLPEPATALPLLMLATVRFAARRHRGR